MHGLDRACRHREDRQRYLLWSTPVSNSMLFALRYTRPPRTLPVEGWYDVADGQSLGAVRPSAPLCDPPPSRSAIYFSAAALLSLPPRRCAHLWAAPVAWVEGMIACGDSSKHVEQVALRCCRAPGSTRGEWSNAPRPEEPNALNPLASPRRMSKEEGRPEFNFYDGPPFATGMPHYGHILAGTIKVSPTNPHRKSKPSIFRSRMYLDTSHGRWSLPLIFWPPR
jgi:hypothetical protein